MITVDVVLVSLVDTLHDAVLRHCFGLCQVALRTGVHEIPDMVEVSAEVLVKQIGNDLPPIGLPLINSDTDRHCSVLARGCFGALGGFWPNCQQVWIDYFVSLKLGESNVNWIVWLVQRFEVSERVGLASPE